MDKNILIYKINKLIKNDHDFLYTFQKIISKDKNNFEKLINILNLSQLNDMHDLINYSNKQKIVKNNNIDDWLYKTYV